jgi:tape measure domain-containing protein
MAKVGAISVTLSAHTMAFARAMKAAQEPLARFAVAVHRTQKVLRSFSRGAVAVARRALAGFIWHFPRASRALGTFLDHVDRATAPLRRFARSGVDAAQKALAKLNRRFPRTARFLSRLGGRAMYAVHRFRRFAIVVGNTAVRALRRLSRAARRAGRSMMRLGGRALTGIMRALTRLRVLALGTIGAFVGIASAGMFFSRSLKLWADFEQATVSLETFFNSAEKAKTMLKDLVRFAAVTPFRFPEILQAARSLAAFGLEREAILPTLRAIGDVASGVNTDIRELAEAYGKVIARNQMMARNLIQFTLRGIPMVRELNKVLGTTGAEMRRMMEEGKISADHMAYAFANMTSEGGQFFDLMKKQASTLGGLWSNLLDQIDIFMGLGEGSFGKQLEEKFKLKGVLAKTIIWMEEHGSEWGKQLTEGLWKGFELVTNIITNMTPLLKGMFEAGITMATGLLLTLDAISESLKKIAGVLSKTIGMASAMSGNWLGRLFGSGQTPAGGTGAEGPRTAVEHFDTAIKNFMATMARLAEGENPILKFFKETENAAFYADKILKLKTQSLMDYVMGRRGAGYRPGTAAIMEIDEIMQGFATAVAEFGKSKYDLMLEKLHSLVAGTSEGMTLIAEAKAAIATLTSKTAGAGVLTDLARWQEKQLSPMERYNRDVATYKRLLDEGTLSVKDWSAAMDMAYATAQDEQVKLNKSVSDMSLKLAPAIMAGTAAGRLAQYKARMQNDDQHRISLNVAKLVRIGNDQLRAQQDTTRALQRNQVDVWGIDGP